MNEFIAWRSSLSEQIAGGEMFPGLDDDERTEAAEALGPGSFAVLGRGGGDGEGVPPRMYDGVGVCPECGRYDGYTNDGRAHWFYCTEHETRWCAGSNLFSSWMDETSEQQRKRWEELGLDAYRVVDPATKEAKMNDPYYLVEVPRDVPDGRIVVHNSVAPAPTLGERGFRAWTDRVGTPRRITCGCGWAPHLPEHYRVEEERDADGNAA